MKRLPAVLVVLGAIALAVAWGRLADHQRFGAVLALAGVALVAIPRFRAHAVTNYLLDNDVLFIAGTVAGLAWANVHLRSYEGLVLPLKDGINDVLMALFFAIAMKEVFEALLPGGPLGSARQAALPLIATAGGMAGPALVYLALARLLGSEDLQRGWAIPCATDIAFAYLIARLVFGELHPAIPFLLLLSIADDAGGLLILAVFYPQGELRPVWLLLVVAGIAIAAVLHRWLKVRSWWPYLVLGGVPSWFGLHEAHIHPALALVPIIPTMPHAKSDLGIFVRGAGGTDALARMEDALAAPVSVILAAFGLANAGVPLGNAGAGTVCVLGGLLVGKPLGISLATLAATRFGLRLPEGLRPREVVVLGVVAGVGFTVALFVATVAFERGAKLDAAKMGALASIAAAPLALLAGKVLRVERRAGPEAPPPPS